MTGILLPAAARNFFVIAVFIQTSELSQPPINRASFPGTVLIHVVNLTNHCRVMNAWSHENNSITLLLTK